jgi:Ca-activated chloride channel family protein
VGDTAVEGRDMQAIKQAALMLEPRGGTAIFSALQRAYEIAGEAQRNDLNRYYSIVLMTDGESNEGLSEAEFMSRYRNLPEAVRRIRVFPVLFGEGDVKVMKRLAEATGGRVFDGRSAPLSQVFKAIRGYQ